MAERPVLVGLIPQAVVIDPGDQVSWISDAGSLRVEFDANRCPFSSNVFQAPAGMRPWEPWPPNLAQLTSIVCGSTTSSSATARSSCGRNRRPAFRPLRLLTGKVPRATLAIIRKSRVNPEF